MNISFSAVSDWRTCQQRYHYRYVDRLQARVKDTAPTMGLVLHRYAELYYTHIKAGAATAIDAHGDALRRVVADYKDTIEGLAFAARVAELDSLAEEFDSLLARATQIADRYYAVHGETDFREQNVLYSELRLEYPLTVDGNIVTPTVVDLITVDRNGTWIWEHKTGRDIPPQTRRLKDLQTTLEIAIVEEALGLHIDGVVWNYMRTKEPTVPALLKKGELTRRADIDTTWETYQREIRQWGLAEEDYFDVRDRLRDAEHERYFPRWRLPVADREQILLRDFITSAQTIEYMQRSGANVNPVRNIGGHCDWCPYSRLCEAVILGNDIDYVLDRYYERRAEHVGTSGTRN